MFREHCTGNGSEHLPPRDLPELEKRNLQYNTNLKARLKSMSHPRRFNVFIVRSHQ